MLNLYEHYAEALRAILAENRPNYAGNFEECTSWSKQVVDYCIADEPLEVSQKLLYPPEHRGKKMTAPCAYDWFDRSHPSAYLHRVMAELIAIDIHEQLAGANPGLPAEVDLSRGASAAAIVAAWEAAGGEQLPGYGDGTVLDAAIYREANGDAR